MWDPILYYFRLQVGLVIGKGGETIKYLQHQSGARIQVARDADSDPRLSTRQVELTGTPEQINRAEQLVKDVIAEVCMVNLFWPPIALPHKIYLSSNDHGSRFLHVVLLFLTFLLSWFFLAISHYLRSLFFLSSLVIPFCFMFYWAR